MFAISSYLKTKMHTLPWLCPTSYLGCLHPDSPVSDYICYKLYIYVLLFVFYVTVHEFCMILLTCLVLTSALLPRPQRNCLVWWQQNVSWCGKGLAPVFFHSFYSSSNFKHSSHPLPMFALLSHVYEL